MAPFDIVSTLGKVGGYSTYLAIGVAFGYILESAGFGNATKLAGQFYFKDLAVVRVMFTAIITAMLLVFLASSLGLLDFEDVWVNPTYVHADIVGGVIMGVGFIVGGYCPGTSLTAMATLKIDGVFFVLGALFGVFVFGEVIDWVRDLWYAGSYGRLTVYDLFGLPAGVTVLMAVGLAFTFFGVMNALQKAFWGNTQ